MAKPIRNTPILDGKDAEIFRREMANIPPANERKKERERIARSVEKLRMMIANLPE